MKNLIFNVFKLIGIMYISISLKNILQIFLGYLSIENDIKIYKIYNIKNTVYSLEYIFQLIIIYDYFIFAIIAYFWVFIILFFLTKKIGNKLWIHISYSLSIYLLAITYYDPFHYNILFIFITIFLGYVNWWLFKKWIKFD
jgi:hypothetical protein